jgi:ABC-type lipoprotein release transport system permease subunit
MGMFKVAWRNIWRNKRRTFLTMGAIAFSTFLFVLFIPIQMGAYDAMIRLALDQYHGHAQIQREGYQDKPQFRLYIEDGLSLAQQMRNSGKYEAVAARTYAYALVQANERAYGAQIIGVETEFEPTVSTIPSNLDKGNYFSNDSASEAVIGAALARNLSAKLGDELLILGMGENGTTAAVIVNIVGIFETKNAELDRALVQIPIKLFQDTFAIRNSAHSILVKGEDFDRQEQLLQQMGDDINSRSANNDLAVLGWEQLVPGMKEAIDLDRNGGIIFMVILVIVVVFSIFNTFLMSVLERTREFGLMLALGARPKNIVFMVAQESMLLNFIGLIPGFIIGFAINYRLAETGFMLPGMEEMYEQFNINIGRLYPDMDPFYFILGPVVVFLATNISSWIPLLRIHRLKPVDAMRTV